MIKMPESVEPRPCRCAELEAEVVALRAQVQWFEAQIRLAQHHRFGASSERSDVLQLSLFNEAEAITADPGDDGPEETITYPRKKKTRGQRELALKNFPVDRIEYRLSAEEQYCAACTGPLHEMSQEIRRELKVVPAEVRVVEHVRYTYSCRNCEHEALTTPVVTAPMPHPAHPGSLASASLLADVLHQKFTLALPLYRQAQEWARLGVPLSRQTLANWVVFAAQTWLEPLYQVLHRHLLQRDILQADETTVQVLHEAGREAKTTSYMWLYRTGSEEPAIVLYEYQPTRAGEHPRKFLSGFKGYLNVDGYGGYRGLPDVVLAGCWSHARRYWDEALQTLPKAARDGPSVAREGLQFCNRLLAIERTVQHATADERLRVRRAQSAPIVEAFGRWLKEQPGVTLPNSGVGRAITYCLNQWEPLQTFLHDGRIAIDNNRSERSIKPFVIGRKGFLFMNTPSGAKASAITYSIIETAKENGLNPRAYLQYLFEELPNRDLEDPATWDAVLPWSAQLPLCVKSPAATQPAS